ncbi:hypothetical protein [Nocardia farcinica]|uniref:hypothetical protein n=1 Tax=Nocardia farcinica TaxID=37329 RepID=UPI00189334F9|nr:hypothetical protein [Nocardia farcinica]MBF6249861.1 hypothetical protein [Nocardia farcinica]
MTPSDRDPRTPPNPNPFDTGLPMLRLPEPPKGRRKRKRPPAAERGRPPRPEPGVIDAHSTGEPIPPLPVPDQSRPSGDWSEWLQPSPSRARPGEPPLPRAPLDEPAPEPEEPAAEEAPRLLPSLVDRTGGNPGPALRRPRPQREDGRSGGDRVLAVLVVVGVLVAVGSILWAVLPGAAPSSAPTSVAAPPPAVAPTTVAPPVATPGCEQRNSGDIVSGTGPGGTTDGPSAILAFEHAYYVLRSGAAARAVVTPDAAVPPADQIQRGIDQVPVGTRYCVRIGKATAAPALDGLARWEVRLTQQYPNEQPKTFTQVIATRTQAGRTLIASIAMG